MRLGGFGADGRVSNLAYEYNPGANTWALLPSMFTARAYFTATALLSGDILVTGGNIYAYMPAFGVTASTEVYHPATRTWTVLPFLHAARAWHTATLLNTGEVLVTGGISNGAVEPPTVNNSAEIFSPSTGTWRVVAAMHHRRMAATATTLLDGRVLVAGGSDGTHALTSAEIYDPSSDTWTEVAPMEHARAWANATLLSDGAGTRVFVVGGQTGDAFGADDAYATATAEYFLPGSGPSGSWVPAPALQFADADCPLISMTSGDLLYFHCNNRPGHAGEIERFHAARWTVSPHMLLDPRYRFDATQEFSGNVLVVGGCRGDCGNGSYPPFIVTGRAELYIP